MAHLLAFLRDDRGAVAIEYVLIGSLISIVCIASATSIGQAISGSFLGPVATAFN